MDSTESRHHLIDADDVAMAQLTHHPRAIQCRVNGMERVVFGYSRDEMVQAARCHQGYGTAI